MKTNVINLFSSLVCLLLFVSCTNSSVENQSVQNSQANSSSKSDGNLEQSNLSNEEELAAKMVKCEKGECDETQEKVEDPDSLVPRYLAKGRPCKFQDKTFKSGDRVTYFNTETVRHGTMCVSEVRICNNGSLSGSFKYSSCKVEERGPEIPTAGRFEGIFDSDGELYVRGWGCQIGSKEPVKVVIVASSNPNPTGFQQGGVLFQGPTDITSEMSISNTCGQGVNSGSNRFSVRVNEKQRIQFMGRYLSAFIVLPDGNWAKLEKVQDIETYKIPEKIAESAVEASPAKPRVGELDQASKAPASVESSASAPANQ